MNEKATDSPYTIEKDDQGRLSAIRLRADGRAVSIDPTNREYCTFLTWAAKQNPPVAEGLGYLEAGSLYFGNEDDVIAYCKENGIALLCHETLGDGKFHLEFGLHEFGAGILPTSIIHSPDKAAQDAAPPPGRYLFYRLYRVTPSKHEAHVDDGGGANRLYGQRLPVFVSHTLLARLDQLLADEDSEVRCVSCWPVQKTFVYVDVSGFSQHPVGHQRLIIDSLIKITNNDQWWSTEEDCRKARAEREANLCIGDGYIFVFRTAHSATYFAGYLAALIESLIAHNKLLEFHFRMSVHTGPVYRFWDRWGIGQGEGRWNYVGRGITDGERVLSAIGKDKDDVVFVSAETRREIMAAPLSPFITDIPALMHNRGRQVDKHGVFRRLYELSHTDWLGGQVEQMIMGNEASSDES